jgi:hypothetical protein
MYHRHVDMDRLVASHRASMTADAHLHVRTVPNVVPHAACITARTAAHTHHTWHMAHGTVYIHSAPMI